MIRNKILALASTMCLCGCLGMASSYTGDALLELPAIEAGESPIIYYVDDDGVNHLAYTVLFDEEHLIPAWVAYDLTEHESRGTAERGQKAFRPDENAGVRQAVDSDYRRSGYTRGHMAPAADFKWNDEAMWDTFYFTNCCPQTAQMNAGAWEDVEGMVRRLARYYGTVYVVTGPILEGNSHKTIGKNNVTVPEKFFKALLICDNQEWFSIGFVMNNDDDPQTVRGSMLTVNDLERMIGLDLFHNMPDSYEEDVEDQLDAERWLKFVR